MENAAQHIFRHRQHRYLLHPAQLTQEMLLQHVASLFWSSVEASASIPQQTVPKKLVLHTWSRFPLIHPLGLR